MGRAAAGAALALVFLTFLSPLDARAASPGPTEPCVPGTVWEDLSSGVKYLCVYDELYGGSRWELLSTGQTGSSAFTYRSSVNGCTYNIVGLSMLSGGGGNSLVRSLRWPCATFGDRTYQPAGELRIRSYLQRYGSTWTTCRDTGFSYNSATAWSWVGGIDMGASPDCGAGTYRTWGTGQAYQGGAWRGASVATAGRFID